MSEDASHGYQAVAARFIAARSRSSTGLALVRSWAASLPPGGSVIDLGCGSGEPMTAALIDRGLAVSAIDAAPAMVTAFQQRFPGVEIACEAAERSPFFGRRFDGALAIGLVFLLPVESQYALIQRIAGALEPAGRLLLTAPRQPCAWDDVLTGRRSVSLGAEAYGRLLARSGLRLVGQHVDEGENHYYAQKQ